MQQSYTHLGKPLRIGKITVKNRFCMAPIGGGQHHLPGGGLKDETIQYLVERAKGGFGLIFTGAIAADGTVDPYTGVGPTILQNPDAFKLTATELNERALAARKFSPRLPWAWAATTRISWPPLLSMCFGTPARCRRN